MYDFNAESGPELNILLPNEVEKLGFFKKFILKAIKKVVNQKIEKTRQEEFMAQNLATSFDHSDKTQIKELVDYCNNH